MIGYSRSFKRNPTHNTSSDYSGPPFISSKERLRSYACSFARLLAGPFGPPPSPFNIPATTLRQGLSTSSIPRAADIHPEYLCPVYPRPFELRSLELRRSGPQARGQRISQKGVDRPGRHHWSRASQRRRMGSSYSSSNGIKNHFPVRHANCHESAHRCRFDSCARDSR